MSDYIWTDLVFSVQPDENKIMSKVSKKRLSHVLQFCDYLHVPFMFFLEDTIYKKVKGISDNKMPLDAVRQSYLILHSNPIDIS